jgi:hypothetical protein
MSDMKLIMESWRQFNEQEGAETAMALDGMETVGDLKKFIKSQRAAKAGSEIAKKAVGATVDAIPGLGNFKAIFDAAKDAIGIVKGLYGAGDNIKTNTHLDNLNVDDEVSKIVDDPIENAFLNYLLNDRFDDDSESLADFNATEELQKFLAAKFAGTTVKK